MRSLRDWRVGEERKSNASLVESREGRKSMAARALGPEMREFTIAAWAANGQPSLEPAVLVSAGAASGAGGAAHSADDLRHSAHPVAASSLDLVINRGQSAPTFIYLTTADPAGTSGDHRADRFLLRHAVHPVAAGGRQRTGGDVVRRLQPAPARHAGLYRRPSGDDRSPGPVRFG